MKKRFLSVLLTLVLALSSSLFVFTPAMAVEWDREAFYKESIAQYGALDFSDPQLIADEDFFGVWNGSEWTTESELHYELYPAMAAIEEAAKKGDYATAKAELLTYFRGRYASFNISNPSRKNLSDQERVQAESYFDNFMPAYKNSISARILFDETDSWQSTNVLSDVKSVAASEEGKISKFQLVASKKDGYLVEVDTRESEFVPYIRALVDGSYKNYYATADTYVYGMEPKVVQGAKETMLVEESVSSIDVPTNRKDAYTKVSFLEFDFDGLTPQNKITEARLYLHGKMMESECPAGIRIPSTTKSVYVMPFIRGASRLAESTLTYSEYAGFTSDYTFWDGYDSPIFNKNKEGYDSNNYMLILSRYFNKTTDAYGSTGDETFAWHSIRLLMGMIKANGTFEQMVARDEAGGMTGGPIDGTFYIGQLGYEVPPMMHKLINSEHMTPDIFSTFLKHMYNCTKFMVTQWCDQDEGHNWGTYSTRGLSALTMYFPEFRDAHDPLVTDENGNPVIKNENEPGGVQGGFIEVAKYRYAYKVGDVIKDNGASVEVSIEYGIEALLNLFRPIVEGAKLNVDPKDYYTPEMIEALSLNTIFLCGHLNPWFGDWQVGDGAGYDMDHPSRVKRILDLNDDPEIRYLVTRGADGKEPSFLALIHDNVGKVTLRNSWNKNAVAAHIEGSGGHGTHGHNDDLSITMAAYGQYLLADPRMGFYGTGEPNEAFLSSTRGHNTVIINDTIGKGDKNYIVEEKLNRVMVDGVLQGPDVVGEITKYPKQQRTDTPANFYPENRETNTVYDFVRGETYAYQNNNAMDSDYFVFRDSLFLHKGYMIVTDYIKPEDLTEENNYEQMWHFMPSANFTMDASKNSFRTHNDNAANIVVATVDDDQTLIPSIKPGIMAFGKGNNVNAPYGNFEKNHTGIVTFNTVLYPMTSSEDIEVYTDALDLDVNNDEGNAFKAQVLEKKSGITTDIQYFTLFAEDLKQLRTFGDYMTDGVLALGEKGVQGYNTAVLRKGKVLEDTTTNSYLIYSNNEVADLGVEWSESTIKLATQHVEGEGSVDLTQLTILANNEVTEVQLNGQNIPFKQQGKYVYFGLNPIIADDTDFNENQNAGTTPTLPSVPMHGSGTVMGGGTVGGSVGGGTVGDVTSGSDNLGTFSDVKGHWAEEHIRAAFEAGIVTGDDKGRFNPEKAITRAELIAMAMRALGGEEAAYNRTFSDVKEGDWYAGSVAQAMAMGIISPDIWFRPNDPVTREEMCKILVGVAEKLGIEVSEDAVATEFADSADISGWAKSFVDKATKLGLMQGMDENNFGAKATANRAQAITVIQRTLAKQ
ncbi:MAG: S-layer homology domain-containing protein [Clostridia bacterium]|nr:S-layer homology domain-containing protein [Clostridia bacterium]